MGELSCAVVTPVGPGHKNLVREAAESVERAIAQSKGPFSRVIFHTVDDTAGVLGRSAARNGAVRQVADRGFDWIFFLDADDLLLPSAFAEITDLAESYSAIWGAIVAIEKGSLRIAVRQPQHMIENVRQLAVLPPYSTIQIGHFVRTDVALRHPFNTDRETGEDIDYFLRVWEAERCVKLPRPLFVNRPKLHSSGTQAGTGLARNATLQAIQLDYRRKAGISDAEARSITQAENARTCRLLLNELVRSGKLTQSEDGVVVASFAVEGIPIHFVVDNPLDVIQNCFVRGRFFEYKELCILGTHVPHGVRVLDVGANVGNHLVYFVKIMGASNVIPIEPNPAAIPMLRKNIELNGIGDHVRSELLGVALGGTRGRCVIGDTPLNNLGATWLRPFANGEIEVMPLDDLSVGDVDFLKIDAEGMEVVVLQGAEQTIRSNRPLMYVEVINHNLQAFHALMDGWGYRVVTEFRYDYASDYYVINYLLRPI